MSGIILCRSEYSNKPYYIPGASINIHSLEEICYFLYNDICLVSADFFCDDLFTYIEKDIKEPELANRLRYLSGENAGLSEMVLTVLRYVDFYSEKEIGKLSNLFSALDTQNVRERLKARADNYLLNGRYNSAISNYEDIAYGPQDSSLGDEFYAKVWHNLGTAHARMMNFSTAVMCFKKALELHMCEETQKAYFTAHTFASSKDSLSLEEGEELSGGDLFDEYDENNRDDEDELMYVAGRELETYMDGAIQTEEYAPVIEAMQYKQEGRIAEYLEAVDKLIERWEKEYREKIK